MYFFSFSTFLCLVLNVIVVSSVVENSRAIGGIGNDSPYRHRVTLDPRGRYVLEWFVDFPNKQVIFNVTAATNGYVGFGLSKRGKMSGADIVIGGVDRSRNSYFTDRHATGNQLPELDESQDWILRDAWERGTQTFLSFSRPFDTCDEKQDIPITDDLLTLIWAFGERDDELEYHFQNKGAYHVYLLDPDLTPPGLNDPYGQGQGRAVGSSNVFSMREEKVIPANDTLYWCSFHRVPTTRKHHIIGYDVTFPTERDRRSVHHLIIYRCSGSEGTPQFNLLAQAEANGGGECYQNTPVGPPATALCSEALHGWGVGGRAVFFPEHVGIPMSENGAEYFMLQVHYDNPNRIANLPVTLSVDAYYTPNIRENDGGTLFLGANVPGAMSLLIPPSSLNHMIFGHCSPDCTNYMLPREGVNVFAAALHTHTTGVAARQRQFRNGREEPWIINDDNYNFDFQQVRILRSERKILPGDHMVTRCTYDTTTRNGSAVTGGFSTRHEMCLGFLYFYTRVTGVAFCASEIMTESYRNLIGIRNTTFDAGRVDTVVTDPPQNMTVAEHATNNIEWDIGLREEIQRQHKHAVHTSICPNAIDLAAIAAAQSQSNAGGTAVVGMALGRFSGRKRRGIYEQANRKDVRGWRQMRRYGAGNRGRAGQPLPMDASEAGNNNNYLDLSQTGGLGGSEVVFPRDIPEYRLPATCGLGEGLSKSFNFY